MFAEVRKGRRSPTHASACRPGMFSRRTNRTQEARVYSRDGPIRRTRSGILNRKRRAFHAVSRSSTRVARGGVCSLYPLETGRARAQHHTTAHAHYNRALQNSALASPSRSDTVVAPPSPPHDMFIFGWRCLYSFCRERLSVCL
eukprot:1181788-Prorocentrum_minimum.AAC.2